MRIDKTDSIDALVVYAASIIRRDKVRGLARWVSGSTKRGFYLYMTDIKLSLADSGLELSKELLIRVMKKMAWQLDDYCGRPVFYKPDWVVLGDDPLRWVGDDRTVLDIVVEMKE